jgi:hypothetical protein
MGFDKSLFDNSSFHNSSWIQFEYSQSLLEYSSGAPSGLPSRHHDCLFGSFSGHEGSIVSGHFGSVGREATEEVIHAVANLQQYTVSWT